MLVQILILIIVTPHINAEFKLDEMKVSYTKKLFLALSVTFMT